ncbi:MAG: DUF1003 domain-containing protein [Planctomycetaceae bacterium]|nr:DUF1003 domain-containing protein [Planctomycetaceae bacterium]MBV8313963.1 DUF1003 domain-containing protein [Planctomycetaceae bacterium]MBV8381017.1 DUF1003 domain-containing protein [Planctomycetaceae bacterium]MBV8553919.1 DUF1003 domain-containing protein [Planctomycetaceae bacterium]
MSDAETLLAESPLFGSLDDEDRAALAESIGMARYAPGEVLFSRGDPGDKLYLVRRGRVQISLVNRVGETIVLAEQTAGDLFGEVAVFDGGSRTAGASAVEETEVLTLGRDDLRRFLGAHPRAALDLLGVMGRRLRNTGELLQDVVTRNFNEEVVEHMTFGERAADRVAAFGGSWTFIGLFLGLLFAWTGTNLWILIEKPFDPYPFILLNLVLSTLAAFQAPVIMMSQNRQSAKDRLKADLDYEVNLKAELEIAQLHRKVDQIYEILQAKRGPLEASPPSGRSASPPIETIDAPDIL